MPTIFGRSTRAISICNPSGYLLVPLLFSPASEEAHDDHGHVIAAHAARLRVGGQAIVHHVLADLVQILLSSNPPPDELDDGLRGLAIPDTYTTTKRLQSAKGSCWFGWSSAKRTIAGKNEKLIIIAQIVHHDVGIRRHDLLFWRELGALLELEVPDGPRESKVPVDAAKVDKATRGRDSRLLACTSRIAAPG